MEKRKRRKFTFKYKAETVRLVAESGKTIGEVEIVRREEYGEAPRTVRLRASERES